MKSAGKDKYVYRKCLFILACILLFSACGRAEDIEKIDGGVVFETVNPEIPEEEEVREEKVKSSDTISFTVMGKETLIIDKDRIQDDYYGEYLDNKWSIEETDAIFNSLKGRWKVDEYVGFIPATLYHGDLFDHNNVLAMEEEQVQALYQEYNEAVEEAATNIPDVTFCIKQDWWGEDTDSNNVIVNGNPCTAGIILSTEMMNDYYPVFADRTTYCDSFTVEYPVLYIQFFLQLKEENEYHKATLVITNDGQFFFLINGAFYSIVEENDADDAIQKILGDETGEINYRDINDDQKDELIIKTTKELYVLADKENGYEIIYKGTYSSLLENGKIQYYRPGGAPLHEDYVYYFFNGMSYEEEASFSRYDWNENDVYDEEDHFFYNEAQVSMDEWNAELSRYQEAIEVIHKEKTNILEYIEEKPLGISSSTYRRQIPQVIIFTSVGQGFQIFGAFSV